MNTDALLDFIASHESRGDFNVVWAGIKKTDRPKKPLVTMTIGEVLAWQDSIDAKYRSEAAGAYQILEDTLRGLWKESGLYLSSLFDEAGQKTLAVALLKRRGLVRYLEGKISTETFANNLAHEWASLPLVSGKGKGRSAYAGDGLNQALTNIAPFLAAVESVKAKPVAPPVTPKPVADKIPPKNDSKAFGWGWIIKAILQGLGLPFRGRK